MRPLHRGYCTLVEAQRDLSLEDMVALNLMIDQIEEAELKRIQNPLGG